MYIYRNEDVLIDIWVNDSSYVIEEIMGEHTVTLNFRVIDPVEFEVNDYVEFEGNVYSIRHKERIRKDQTSLGWEYFIKFYAEQYALQNVAFFLQDKPDRKKNHDYFIGTAKEMLELIVKNMNRVYTGWQVGSYIETDAVNFSFKDKTCAAVLDEVAKAFETEYRISGKMISLGKREYASNGLILGQGEGMGFKDLEITAMSETPPVTVLYPYGSDQNLTTAYGYDYLLMPGAQLSLEKNVEKYGRFEENRQFDHIYPKGEFTVTQKIDEVTFRASGIDFDLAEYRINEEDIFVTFQIGGLAGYDLAILTENKGQDLVWDYQNREITLAVNEDEKDLAVPGDIHFSVGDKFILTGLKMPQKYIDEAEEKLREAAETYLEENCEKKVQLSGKCDEVFFRKFNTHIACGQMVGIISEKLDIDREIRVTKVKRFLENNEPPYRYELTLSDFLQSNGFKAIINDIHKFPEEMENSVRPVKEWTKRNWRDVMETMKMMFDPEGDYFTELVKPLAVHTAQLIVGTNSQQFDLAGVKFSPNADNNPNLFRNTQGRLVHFTVDPDQIMEWSVPAASFSLSNSLAYYVYARCSKRNANGEIVVSDKQIKLEDEAGFYNFWVGVLNTPEENIRSWNPSYGFTEIAGNTITTGVIKDKNARLTIDLTQGQITGPVKFTSGSSGYNNISDKPDLNNYVTQSQFTIKSNEISASVFSVSNRVGTLETKSAGWITEDTGNTLWASVKLENGEEIISKIEQTPENVKIKASKITLEGYTTISKNFRIDENGDMECINGKFSGQVTATSGKIGGFSVYNSFLLFGLNDNYAQTSVKLGRSTPSVAGITGPAVEASQSITSYDSLYSPAIGLKASATGSKIYNRAIDGVGSIITKQGAVYGLHVPHLANGATIPFGVDISNTYLTNGKEIVLPTKENLCSALGVTTTASFALTFTIISSLWAGGNLTVHKGSYTNHTTIELRSTSGDVVNTYTLKAGSARTLTIYNTYSEYRCYLHS